MEGSVRPPAPPPPAPAAAPPPPPPAAGHGQSFAELVRPLRTPAALGALIAGAIAFVATVLGGLLVAVVTPTSSVIGGFTDLSIFKEAMLQACALVRAPFEGSIERGEVRAGLPDISAQSMPTLGLLIPLAGMALGVRSQLGRSAFAAPGVRLAWAAVAALVFALLMLIPAAIGETDDSDPVVFAPAMGTVFGLSLLWALVGALIGAHTVVGDALDRSGERGARTRELLRPPAAALRALAIALALSAALMTVFVVIQTLRDDGDAVGDRSKGGAVVENATYVVEHGTHGVELGTFASFELTAGEVLFAEDEDTGTGIVVPLPVRDVEKLADVEERDDEGQAPAVGGLGRSEDDDDDARASFSYGITDYSEVMAGWVFAPWLLVMLAIPALLALYAGFSSARAAGAATPQAALGWGALAGPVWALAMLLLNEVVKGTELINVFGAAQGDSVFGWTLLIVTALGAAGGLLAVRQRAGRAA